MESSPTWLPDLITLDAYNGNWSNYQDALYKAFQRDFIEDKGEFQGLRIGLKRHPLTNNKEATFWHFIQSGGSNEQERTPDIRRCERICWPKAIIKQADLGSQEVLYWEQSRGANLRLCLYLECENYLVILDKRSDYILPWTAYPVERGHSQRKLMKQYEDFRRIR